VGVLLARRRHGLRPSAVEWLPDRAWIGRILHVGIPAGVDSVANAACHLGFLSIVNRLGDVAAAAHSVAITIESLAFLPGSAFMVAAGTMAGQFLGAGDERRARRSVWQAALACLGLMSAAGAVFLAAADPLAGWFVGGVSRQPDVASLTARLVRIVAFAQPPLALLMVLSGGLRGAGATRLPLAVNFLGLILVRLPLAVLLSRPEVPLPGGLAAVPGLGLGVVGAWYAMAADLTVRGLAMLVIFRWSRWSRVVV
jgi:Na+-driven multidrug efflux pump